MSLDFDLINQSSTYSLQKLCELKKTSSPHLFLLEDFLNPLLVKKLYNFIIQNNLTWEKQEDTKNSYLPNREKINWIPDTVVEEAHIVFSALTEKLNETLHKKSNFSGISIWKDTTGFTIPEHSDNPVISYAIQLYLVNGPQNLSTVFEYKNEQITTKFKTNSGYLMDNESKLIHYINGSVPENFTRFSLYAIWTLT
jgi:hypothetical protein